MQLSTDLNEKLQKIRAEGEEREAERRAVRTGFPYLNLANAPVQVEALTHIPEERAKALGVALFEYKKPHGALAVYDPEDAQVEKLVEELKKDQIEAKVYVVSRRGLMHLWNFYSFVPQARKDITGRVNISKQEVDRLRKELVGLPTVSRVLRTFDFSHPSIVEFLELTLAGAIANGASDIHFESEEHAVKLRYRIDGILHDIWNAIPHEFYRKVVSRIKLLSNLKINVMDRPQDGRFTIELGGAKEVEIRAAVAPSEYGEIIVLRILDPDTIRISLEGLGLRADDLTIVKEELERPNGMILNTGPTGSGKTTTLYAFLIAKYNPEIKIITIEDPIEYHLEGIEQTQVHEESHYTFANGLRSIMRQDPDVMLVGEIRDADTAEIALQAALTGHLVFSTIHANDAAGAIPRLLDLNVRPSSIGSAINLVIAQRLVRRLCPNCKKEKKLTNEERKRYESFLKKIPARAVKPQMSEIQIYESKGCDACSGLGYKGRVAIFELFPVSEEIEDHIVKGVGEGELRRIAATKGMVTMQEDGILKVFQGVTSISEVESVTGKVAWGK